MESRPRMKSRMFGYNVRDKLVRDEKLVLIKAKLQNDMNLNILREEARGANGHVIAATTSGKDKKEIAIKIITKNNISDSEYDLWPQINHKNVLIIMQREYFPDLDVYLLISPLHSCNLGEIVKTEIFLKSSDGLKLVMKWLMDTLLALHYLQRKGFCHLAIKPSSILVSCDQDAVLCDFHCMDKTYKATKRYALTYRDRPPEVCTSLDEKRKIAADGMAFDAWSIGVLALKLFTGDYVKKKIPVVFNSWMDGVYPHLFDILQKKCFTKYCKAAFPACRVDEEMTLPVMNFITSCLRPLPEDRPCAGSLTEHKCMNSMGCMQKRDSIWKHKHKKLFSNIYPFRNLGGGDAPELSVPETENTSVVISETPTVQEIKSSEDAPMEKHGMFCKVRCWLRSKTSFFRRHKS